MNNNIRIIAAETIGTAFLVLLGCGSIIVNDLYNNVIGHIGIAVSFGIIVMTMIYSVGNISGAHLNPAVTLGFFLARRIKAVETLPYLPSQFGGAIIGAVILKLLFPEHNTLGATLPDVGMLQAFVIEAIMTALLMFVILNVSTGHMEKGIMAGVAIGGTIMLEAIVAGPLTGASMNPARTLAPALLSMNVKHLWIYFAGPAAGAVIASQSCKLVQGDQCCSVQ